MLRKGVIYVRASTDLQTVDAQKSKCLLYAKLHNIHIVGVFEDVGKSGKSAKDRTGLKKALSALKPNMCFVVYEISRISRNLRLFSQITKYLEKKDCTLHSVTQELGTGASGKFLRNLLALVAEFEAEQLSERTKYGMAQAKAKGRVPGPKCYNNIGVIKSIQLQRAQGVSYRKIAENLNNWSVLSPRGRSWTKSSVYHLSRRSLKQ